MVKKLYQYLWIVSLSEHRESERERRQYMYYSNFISSVCLCLLGPSSCCYFDFDLLIHILMRSSLSQNASMLKVW